jgi:hypothetical protein
MKRKLAVFIIVNTIYSAGLYSQSGWQMQPVFSFDKNKNIKYFDEISNAEKTIFPVMLYGFQDNTESDSLPINTSNFWAEADKWGFNIIYSQKSDNKHDIFYKYQRNFINNCNKYSKLCMLKWNAIHDVSGIFAFPDEPISSTNYVASDFHYIKSINTNKNPDVLGYLNFSIHPYLYRSKHETKTQNIFESKLKIPWHHHSTTSYTELAKFSDIISFDFYPFNHNGIISKHSVLPTNELVKASVGEFTRLLKYEFYDKAIWAVIQTLWYDPYTEAYQGNYIHDKIIRQLTFDAIINGADGISFWGHGSVRNSYSPGGIRITNEEDSIWKHTLYQTHELKELQENFDQILLEENLPDSFVSNGDIKYCFKQVINSNKYYFFAVSSSKYEMTTKIEIPDGYKLVDGTMESIGLYAMPPINGISSATIKDYRNPKAIVHVAGDGKSFYTNLEKFGTNIISMELTLQDENMSMIFDSKGNSGINDAILSFTNFPNPFPEVTTIKFELIKPSFVQLKVYNNSGSEIATLVNEFKNAGPYYYNFNGSNLAGGIYYYKIKTNELVQTNTMILIKK